MHYSQLIIFPMNKRVKVKNDLHIIAKVVNYRLYSQTRHIILLTILKNGKI